MTRSWLPTALLFSLACAGDLDGDESIDLAEAQLAAGNYAFQTGTGTNKCIDVAGGRNADGTNIHQWNCHGGPEQAFRVENVSGSRARLVHPQTGKCLDVAGAGTNDGTNIQLWTCNGTGAQQFEVLDAGGGRVIMRNPNSGKCVDVASAGTNDGANIQLWTCNGTVAQSFKPISKARPTPSVTFFTVSDTHADPPESYDLRAMARAINAVAANGQWPARIGNQDTGFTTGAIGNPAGVVFTGDIMGWGVSPTELLTFRRYFEKGRTNESINFPAYIGLGNHDVDNADRTGQIAEDYRNQAWAFVDSRHKGANAPVPVTNFDAGSHAFSWDMGGVHFIQTHRFPGDRGYGLPSSLPFVANDLRSYASDGRPVVLFHHYGMDAFGTQDRWWTAADRAAYKNTLNGYAVSAIIAGHTHYAMNYNWEGQRVFQVNNAKAEINAGNNDGRGSFAIVRITGDKVQQVTCRWIDDTGRYELIAPFYSGPLRP